MPTQEEQPQVISPESTKEYNNFVGGIITEASPLTFPANASKDEENFLLTRKGTRLRRLGINYENDYTKINPAGPAANDRRQAYFWKGAGGSDDKNFVVVQWGRYIYFHPYHDASGDSISANASIFTYDIGVSRGSTLVGFASGNGNLFMGHLLENPEVFTFDGASTITSSTYTVDIRDFFGVEESPALDIIDRPTTVGTDYNNISNTHHYNLRNQGWLGYGHLQQDLIQTFAGDPKWVLGALTYSFPSNADIATTFYTPDSAGLTPVTQLLDRNFGTSEAPKGAMVINAFARGTGRKAAIDKIETDLSAGAYSTAAIAAWSTISDSTTARPTVLGFYAGRVWHSGLSYQLTGGDSKSPNYQGYVFFSQSIKNEDSYGKCYQAQDPTSSELNELLADDGGYINIVEASGIKKLLPVGNSLVVFASNGVWGIGGAGDSAFAADTFEVYKISNSGILGPQCVTNTPTGAVYFGEGGIYSVEPSQATGRLVSVSVSERTIQTLYNQIPLSSKQNAKLSYDPSTHNVTCMYSAAAPSSTFLDHTDTMLILNTSIGSYYTHTLSSLAADSPMVSGAIVTNRIYDLREQSQTKFFSYIPTGTDYTFSEFTNTGFKDWQTEDAVGADYTSFVDTGYEILNDTQRDKWASYVTINCALTEETYIDNGSGEAVLDNQSSCKFQAKWGFTNNVSSGKWTNLSQAYRFLRAYGGDIGDSFDYGEEVITTKNRIRGQGKALSMRFESESGKDLQLLGWAITFEGNSYV